MELSANPCRGRGCNFRRHLIIGRLLSPRLPWRKRFFTLAGRTRSAGQYNFQLGRHRAARIHLLDAEVGVLPLPTRLESTMSS